MDPVEGEALVSYTRDAVVEGDDAAAAAGPDADPHGHVLRVRRAVARRGDPGGLHAL